MTKARLGAFVLSRYARACQPVAEQQSHCRFCTASVAAIIQPVLRDIVGSQPAMFREHLNLNQRVARAGCFVYWSQIYPGLV